MFSSLLIIAIVGGALFGVHRWQTRPPEERAAFAKKALIYGVVGGVLALVVTGKAHWLMGVLAALLALLARVAQFAQYTPMFKKMMGGDVDPQAQQRESQSVQGSMSSMSHQEAADILGIEPNANADDIKQAHKRLMQKLHPDRGGSEALAKQINLAKDILLKSGVNSF